MSDDVRQPLMALTYVAASLVAVFFVMYALARQQVSMRFVLLTTAILAVGEWSLSELTSRSSP